MADLPLEGRTVQTDDKKEVPLTVEQKLELVVRDVQEIARAVNTHGALLESMVHAADSVVKSYLTLIGKYVPPTKTTEKKNKPKPVEARSEEKPEETK